MQTGEIWEAENGLKFKIVRKLKDGYWKFAVPTGKLKVYLKAKQGKIEAHAKMIREKK